MKSLARRFIADDAGAVSIEYALIAILISVAIIGGASRIAPTLNEAFDRASAALDSNVTN